MDLHAPEPIGARCRPCTCSGVKRRRAVSLNNRRATRKTNDASTLPHKWDIPEIVSRGPDPLGQIADQPIRNRNLRRRASDLPGATISALCHGPDGRHCSPQIKAQRLVPIFFAEPRQSMRDQSRGPSHHFVMVDILVGNNSFHQMNPLEILFCERARISPRPLRRSLETPWKSLPPIPGF